MSLALLLALQAAAAPAGVEPADWAPGPVAALDFDLARYRPAGPAERGCRADDPAPIMVCARRPSGGAYPMAQWARIFEVRPLRAETSLGGGAILGIHSQAAEIAPGMVSNRVMIGLRTAF